MTLQSVATLCRVQNRYLRCATGYQPWEMCYACCFHRHHFRPPLVTSRRLDGPRRFLVACGPLSGLRSGSRSTLILAIVPVSRASARSSSMPLPIRSTTGLVNVWAHDPRRRSIENTCSPARNNPPPFIEPQVGDSSDLNPPRFPIVTTRHGKCADRPK